MLSSCSLVWLGLSLAVAGIQGEPACGSILSSFGLVFFKISVQNWADTNIYILSVSPYLSNWHTVHYDVKVTTLAGPAGNLKPRQYCPLHTHSLALVPWGVPSWRSPFFILIDKVAGLLISCLGPLIFFLWTTGSDLWRNAHLILSHFYRNVWLVFIVCRIKNVWNTILTWEGCII